MRKGVTFEANQVQARPAHLRTTVSHISHNVCAQLQAAFWYANLDRLIHYVNLDGRVNALYSTPSIYAAAKINYGAANPLPVKTDDYMPLIDGPHSVWAGYFTSRSALKAYIRETSSYHQAARQLQVLSGGAADLSPANPLYLLERAMGVAQHHDAVSGTSKQHVAYDYAKRLAVSRLTSDTLLASALANLTADASATFVTCDLANVTICPALEAGTASIVAVYNNQGQERPNVLLRFPVGNPASGSTYAVYDATGAAVTAQLIPVTAVDTHLRTEYYAYNSITVTWLAFVGDLPPMGYTTYFIVPTAAGARVSTTKSTLADMMPTGTDATPDNTEAGLDAPTANPTMTNGIVTLTFNASTGLVTLFEKNGTSTPFGQNFGWYNASAGEQDSDLPQAGQASGAYILRYAAVMRACVCD